MALIAVQRGDVEAAEEQYAVLESRRGTMFSLGMMLADRILGLLSQTIGQIDQAMVHFEDALAFCRKAGYQPELAWTCSDYAEALLKRNGPNDREKAMSLLEESVAISQELGMPPLMEKVVARQQQAESASHDAQKYPNRLTEREVEVLQLIADGRSNNEIAAALVLSVRTVERHVTNIYSKINARGRADATAYALGHGLTLST